MRYRLLNLFTLLSLPLCVAAAPRFGAALACSGPGAWRTMRDADIYGSWSAFWVTLLLVPVLYLLVRAGRPILALAHTLLLALHPSWTVSAWHGDCGTTKVFASTAFVLLAIAAVPESVLIAVRFSRPWRWSFNARREPGFCQRCGYDLRATPERCPECGTEIRVYGLTGDIKKYG